MLPRVSVRYRVAYGNSFSDASSAGSCDLRIVGRICLEESDLSVVSGELTPPSAKAASPISPQSLSSQVPQLLLKGETFGVMRGDRGSPSPRHNDSRAQNRYSIEEEDDVSFSEGEPDEPQPLRRKQTAELPSAKLGRGASEEDREEEGSIEEESGDAGEPREEDEEDVTSEEGGHELGERSRSRTEGARTPDRTSCEENAIAEAEQICFSSSM